jgi:hypothetical protein
VPNPTEKKQPGDFFLALRPLNRGAGDAPPAIRLRMALKILLRRFGLKCVIKAVEVPDETTADGPLANL